MDSRLGRTTRQGGLTTADATCECDTGKGQLSHGAPAVSASAHSAEANFIGPFSRSCHRQCARFGQDARRVPIADGISSPPHRPVSRWTICAPVNQQPTRRLKREPETDTPSPRHSLRAKRPPQMRSVTSSHFPSPFVRPSESSTATSSPTSPLNSSLLPRQVVVLVAPSHFPSCPASTHRAQPREAVLSAGESHSTLLSLCSSLRHNPASTALPIDRTTGPTRRGCRHSPFNLALNHSGGHAARLAGTCSANAPPSPSPNSCRSHNSQTSSHIRQWNRRPHEARRSTVGRIDSLRLPSRTPPWKDTEEGVA